MTHPFLAGCPAALAFDFNGTLSDDEDLCGEIVCSLALTRLGVRLDPEKYFETYAGHTEHAMFTSLRRLAVDAGHSPPTVGELVAEFTERYLEALRGIPRISDDARSLILAAHADGIPLAVVTAAHAATVIPALEMRGILPLFSAIVTLDDVEHPKPHPEAYLLAARLLQIADRSSIVVFEDSRAGIASARAANMQVIGVAGTVPPPELQTLTDTVVDRLHPGILDRISAVPATN